MTIYNQDILKDYVSGNRFKTYKYVYDYPTKEDIKIILTPIVGDFNIFVYSNNKINYDEKLNTFSAWEYSSKELKSNEIFISKNDLKSLQTLYIVVALDDPSKTINGIENSYYIGISDSTNGITLQSEVPIVSNLDKKWPYQIFNYVLASQETMDFSLNIFSGAISASITVNYLEIKNIICKQDCSLQVKWSELISNCSTEMCNIGISLKDESYSIYGSYIKSKYYLIVKAFGKSPELLFQGMKKHSEVQFGEENYYYIYTQGKSTLKATVFFTDANGKLYANLIKRKIENKSELIRNLPNKTNNNIQFKSNYWNFQLELNENEINNCEDACTLLITVKGENDFYNNKKSIEYDISITNEIIEISVNKPFTNSVVRDTFQYYRIHINNQENVKNLIFTLSSLEGDADLFINMNETTPTKSDHDFKSDDYETEIVQLSLETDKIKDKKLDTLAGTYTIGVYSTQDSTYTLFVSEFDKKLLPIDDYYPSSCYSSKGESCYFNYLLTWVDYTIQTPLDSIKAVVYFNFKYGSNAKITGKFVSSKDIDFNKVINNNKIDFSNDKEMDFMHIDIKLENYPEIFNMEKIHKDYYHAKQNGHSLDQIDLTKINKEYLQTLDPTILIEVKCFENCAYSIHTAERFFDDEFYLDPYYDNIVYMPKNFITNLYYYNYDDNIAYDMQFDISKGKTYFNVVSGSEKSEIEEYFISQNRQKVQVNDFTLNFTSQDMLNKNVNIKKNNNISQIKSQTFDQESIFFVKVISHHNWIKLQPGSDNILTDDSIKYDFDGRFAYFLYFDINPEYDGVNINIECLNFEDCDLDGYGSYFNSSSNLKLETTIPPNTYNFKVKAETFENNNSFYMVFTKPIEKGKIMGLISIFLKKKISIDNSILITLSPIVGLKTVTSLKKAQTIYNNKLLKSMNADEMNKFIDVFEIEKGNSKDSIIIHLSTCLGKIDFKLFDKPYFDFNSSEQIYYEFFIEGGKIQLRVKNPKSNIYLAVKYRDFETLSYCNLDKSSCYNYSEKESLYSVFYNYEVETNDVDNSSEIFKNSQLIVENIKGSYTLKFTDISQNTKKNASQYLLFMTKQSEIYEKFNSPCFLSLIKPYKDITSEIKQNKNYHEYNLDFIENGSYYIGLGVVLKNGEIFSFSPAEVTVVKRNTLLAILIIFSLIIAVAILFYLYKKTKERLEYERSDIMASTNSFKTDKELKDLKENKELNNIKYSTLSLDSSEI